MLRVRSKSVRKGSLSFVLERKMNGAPVEPPSGWALYAPCFRLQTAYKTRGKGQITTCKPVEDYASSASKGELVLVCYVDFFSDPRGPFLKGDVSIEQIPIETDSMSINGVLKSCILSASWYCWNSWVFTKKKSFRSSSILILVTPFLMKRCFCMTMSE